MSITSDILASMLLKLNRNGEKGDFPQRIQYDLDADNISPAKIIIIKPNTLTTPTAMYPDPQSEDEMHFRLQPQIQYQGPDVEHPDDTYPDDVHLRIQPQLKLQRQQLSDSDMDSDQEEPYQEPYQEPIIRTKDDLILQQQELIRQQRELIQQQREELTLYKTQSMMISAMTPKKKHKKTVRFQLMPKKSSRSSSRRSSRKSHRKSSLSRSLSRARMPERDTPMPLPVPLSVPLSVPAQTPPIFSSSMQKL